MAKIPSSQDVRRSVPQFARPIVAINPDQTGSALAGIGDKMAAIGEAEIRHEQETAHRLALARFESEMSEGYNDLLGSLREDGNYNQHVPKFQRGAQSLLQEKLQYIKDPQQQELMALRAKEQMSNLSFKVANNAHSMRADAETANWLSKSDKLTSAYSTLDPIQRKAELRSWQKYGQTLRDQRLLSSSKFAEADAKMAKNISIQELLALDPADRLSVLFENGKPLRDSAGTQVADDIIDVVVAEAGLDNEWVKFAKTVAAIESSGNPSARSIASNGKYVGLFQMGEARASEVGVVDRLDPEQNTRGFITSMQDYEERLKKLGIDHSWANLYLAHQQGFGGATALLKDENANVVDALVNNTAEYRNNRSKAELAVIQNGGNLEMTAGQFADKWRGKITGGEYNKYLANLDEDDRQSLINDTQKQLEQIDLSNKIRAVVAGEQPLDYTDTKEMKAWDNLFRDSILPAADNVTDPYAANATIANQLANATVIPKSVKAYVRGKMRSNDENEIIRATDLFMQLQETNPQIVEAFSKSDIMLASSISASLRAGIPQNEAIAMARNALEPINQETRQHLQTALTSIDLDDKAKDIFDTWIPFEGSLDISENAVGRAIAAHYKQAFKEHFLTRGDEDAATDYANSIIKGRYYPTDFNDVGYMAYAPEQYYRFGNDVDWIQKDWERFIQEELDADGEYWIHSDDATSRNASVGTPDYAIMKMDEETGLPMAVAGKRWRPDISSVKEAAIEKARGMREASKILEDVDMKMQFGLTQPGKAY